MARERARKKEKTLTERAAARRGLFASSCQASWKERSTIRLLFLSLSFLSSLSFFFATTALRSLSQTHGYVMLLASPSAFLSSLSFSLSISLPYHGRVPKKRREKATRDLAVGAKNHRRRCYHHHHRRRRRRHHCPAKTTLHLRTCANCGSKPPRTCSSRSDRVFRGVTRIN